MTGTSIGKQWPMASTRSTLTAAATAVVLTVTNLVIASASASIAPGTASQVQALVTASSSISALASDVTPSLATASADRSAKHFPVVANACATATQCVFGDKAPGAPTIVLYGDSHAQMWLPAVVAAAQVEHLKVVLIWHPGCPEVSVVSSWPVCKSFRIAAIKTIAAMKPVLVLLSNKTTNVVGPTGSRFSDAIWQAAQSQTIAAVSSPSTKVAVVGDIGLFNAPVPPCLAAYSNNVQKCSVSFPNARFTQHYVAEKAAAVASKAGYVNTLPWLCRKTCSPVIGKMIVYYDADHVTSTYAMYLSGLWDKTLRSLLGR
jgi:hypothetical protein